MTTTLSAAEVTKIRSEFPALATLARGKPLVYLDNAATTLKPRPVVDVLTNHFMYGAANVHRAVHFLSEQATKSFEGTREKVRVFLNAKEKAEIIFTSGSTAAINLVANSYGSLLNAGDEIVITEMEHHSNIVPWQMLCERKGLTLKVAPIDDDGQLKLPELEALLTSRTKLLATVAVSNALGTVNPLKILVAMAHAKGIPVLFDAAQAAPHMKLDVQDLGVDFLVLSAHKLYAPTGVGILYGRRELLEKLPPFLGGGDMIRSVSFLKTTYAELPARLEAGTPDIGGVIALGAAIDYLNAIGLDRIAAYEHELLVYGTQRLADIPDLRLIGTAKDKASILSFVLGDVHPHDIGSLLDADGIAIRAGHHCAQPLMARFAVPATARASLAFYNTKEEIDQLATALAKIWRMFQ